MALFDNSNIKLDVLKNVRLIIAGQRYRTE